MITVENVRQVLDDRIEDDVLTLEITETGAHKISVQAFVDRYHDAEALTKDALTSHPNATPRWIQYFEHLFG